MNHSYVKHETVMVNKITSHYNMNHSCVKHEKVKVCLTQEWFILL
jgi:hypothetical protein